MKSIYERDTYGEIESLAAREEIERSFKQAREDIESGNLFSADTVFAKLRGKD